MSFNSQRRSLAPRQSLSQRPGLLRRSLRPLGSSQGLQSFSEATDIDRAIEELQNEQASPPKPPAMPPASVQPPPEPPEKGVILGTDVATGQHVILSEAARRRSLY